MSNFSFVSIFTVIVLIYFQSSAHADITYTDIERPQPLSLIDSLPLYHESPLQPSGLSVCQNRLLMVSDNQNSSIYELHPSNKEHPLSLFQKIIVSPPPLPSSLPWKEGIKTRLSMLFSPKNIRLGGNYL